MSSQLILVSGLGSVIGPLIGTNLMVRCVLFHGRRVSLSHSNDKQMLTDLQPFYCQPLRSAGPPARWERSDWGWSRSDYPA